MPLLDGTVPIEVLCEGLENKVKLVDMYKRKGTGNWAVIVAGSRYYNYQEFPFAPGTYDFKVVGKNENEDEIEAILTGVVVVSGQTGDIVQADYQAALDESRGGFAIGSTGSR